MEKKEKTEHTLLDTYLDYHHLTILPRKGAKEPKRDGMTFMPMLLMDAMNMLYDEYIAPLPLRHEQKRLRSWWHDAYMQFVAQAFMPFNDDQKDELVTKMLEFEDDIHDEVEMFRVASMNHFMGYDTDVRIALSAILACNALAQSAQILYKAQHRKENKSIALCEQWSLKLLNKYGDDVLDRTVKQIDLNSHQDTMLASKKMCSAVVKFAEKWRL
jgi:hypothetical protein